MFKAVKDFDHLGVKVRAGQEVPPKTFTSVDMAGLVSKGLLAEDKQKDELKDEPEKVRRSKTK